MALLFYVVEVDVLDELAFGPQLFVFEGRLHVLSCKFFNALADEVGVFG